MHSYFCKRPACPLSASSAICLDKTHWRFNSLFRFISFKKDFRREQPTDLQEAIMITFTAVLHQEDDLYVAECPEVGTISQGRTVEEAVSNLKEATELYLQEFPLVTKKRTILTTFEVSSIATS
jgi:predicted RNase H-like HicB family nuclease